MQTTEIIITDTWVKLADSGDDPATITNLSRSKISIAFTPDDSAPSVNYGHLLGPGASLERYNSAGYIWGKNTIDRPDSIVGGDRMRIGGNIAFGSPPSGDAANLGPLKDRVDQVETTVTEAKTEAVAAKTEAAEAKTEAAAATAGLAQVQPVHHIVRPSADDYAEITAAITGADNEGGGVIELGRGIFTIDHGIVTKSNIALIGQGRKATTLKTSATSGALPDGFLIGDGGNEVNDVTISRMGIVGHGKNEASGSGIKLLTGLHNNVQLQDLDITGFPEFCIRIHDPMMSSFANIFARDAGIDAIYIDLGTSYTMDSVYATASGRSNLHLENGTYVTLTATAAEYASVGYWLKNMKNLSMNAPGGEVAMNSDNGGFGFVTHYLIESCKQTVINAPYSTRFAYLNGVPARHWTIAGACENVIINAPRGTADLGGAEDFQAPTNTMVITADVVINSPKFDGETGNGVSGTYKRYQMETV